jgi:choline dehydrogenase-like flavoprotein
LSWPILDAFRSAAEQSGIASIDDFNQGDNEGCGYFQVNQKSGIRWNAAKAFLKPMRNRPNLTVLTGVEVDRVLLENGRASRSALDGKIRRRLSRPARKSSSAPAPLAHQASCNAPASALARCCNGWASASSMNCPALAATCRITCNCG